MDNSLGEVEEKTGYVFKNKKNIITALTHKSYAHEKKMSGVESYNERLEFLGDAILEHIISNKLFNVSPSIKEGEMTKKRARIVCEESLSGVIKKDGLDKYIKLGKCELNTNGRNNNAILGDMFEAILGAIYIDGGFDEAERFGLYMLSDVIEKEILNIAENTDYKTRLQEAVQRDGPVEIIYKLKGESGVDHDKIFCSNVLVNGEIMGEGNGKTKKQSEQQAAKKALQKFNNKG